MFARVGKGKGVRCERCKTTATTTTKMKWMKSYTHLARSTFERTKGRGGIKKSSSLHTRKSIIMHKLRQCESTTHCWSFSRLNWYQVGLGHGMIKKTYHRRKYLSTLFFPCIGRIRNSDWKLIIDKFGVGAKLRFLKGCYHFTKFDETDTTMP